MNMSKLSPLHWPRIWSIAVVALTLCASSAARDRDVSDHPLLSRLAGMTITEKTTYDFSVVTVSPAGHLPANVGRTFEGRVTSINYAASNGQSSEVKIYRNYLNAAKQMGGRQLNEGFDAASPIGLVTGDHVFTLSPAAQPPIAVLNIGGSGYRLTIIEPAVMEQSVRGGSQIAEQIKKTGVATLHINFDTAKADLKDDGRAAVQEIAAVLKGDPGLKLSIEGHTDNVGQPADNKKLSLARADAVMRAVVAQGIDAKRLSAKGYGQEKPVADNAAEAGRAQNRRVELVKVK